MRTERRTRAFFLLTAAALPVAAGAQAPVNPAIDYGVVLDAAYSSKDLALGERSRGLGLGHTEATIGGSIDDAFAGRLTVAAHSHDDETEIEIEEAFIETRLLPAGLSLRAGRFLSQIGYLNEQHPHADDFVTRPLPYRAFLGSHYFDAGIRLNWVAPTDQYIRLGIELFDGKKLTETAGRRSDIGAIAVGARTGGDVGMAHSWQAGVGLLHSRLRPGGGASEAEDAHGDEHDHDHAHGALFGGRNLWSADAVWKWAPRGNNRERQLRVSAEYMRVNEPAPFAGDDDYHEGWYLSAVYRFLPQWEAGVRHGALKVREPHGDHFHGGRMQETELMLTWKRSHFSAIRLQWTTQRNRAGFPDAGDAVMLQYVMSLGGHGAHLF